jgi:hypothetical protein
MNTLYLWVCIFAAGFGAARGWFEYRQWSAASGR